MKLPKGRHLRGGPFPEACEALQAASSCSDSPSETPIYAPSESSADSAPPPAPAQQAPASPGMRPCISACRSPWSGPLLPQAHSSPSALLPLAGSIPRCLGAMQAGLRRGVDRTPTQPRTAPGLLTSWRGSSRALTRHSVPSAPGLQACKAEVGIRLTSTRHGCRSPPCICRLHGMDAVLSTLS